MPQVVEMMRTLYSVCHLVHADLSEYNILWWQKQAWFIDVSQAVEPSYPAGELIQTANSISDTGLYLAERVVCLLSIVSLLLRSGLSAQGLHKHRQFLQQKRTAGVD